MPTTFIEAIITIFPQQEILKNLHAKEKQGLQAFKLGHWITRVSNCRTEPMSTINCFIWIDDKLIDWSLMHL